MFLGIFVLKVYNNPSDTMLKTIFHRYIRQKGPPACTIQHILPELVETILMLLYLPDQICFALSCKFIFTCSQSLLKWSKVPISQILQSNACFNIPLLCQLENDRWQVCRWCWHLHPYSKLRAFRSVWGLRQKPCYPVRDLSGYTIKDA